MEIIITISSLTTAAIAFKYHKYKVNKAYFKGYEAGYTLAYYTRHTSPLIIRDNEGKAINAQALDYKRDT